MRVTREVRAGRSRRSKVVAILLLGTTAIGVGLARSDDRPTDPMNLEATEDRAPSPDADRPSEGRDLESPTRELDAIESGGEDGGLTGRAIAAARPSDSPSNGTTGGSTSPSSNTSTGRPAPSSPTTPDAAPNGPGSSGSDPTPRGVGLQPDLDPPVVPEPPDIQACANLGHVAVGHPNDDPDVIAAAPRFRAMFADVSAREPVLVCARAVQPWRDDLYVQTLIAGGREVGMLIAGRDPEDPVLFVNRNEWAGWGWRDTHNYVGVPTGRTVLDGVPVILTTRGGVVVEHPDTMAIPVVNGAWLMWMQRGGPSGDMGMPVGRAQGLARIATWQDFVGGRVVLPLVETGLEAEAQPFERYSWVPWSEVGPPTRTEVPLRSVVENAGASYYVADDGKRYWIRTTGNWECARRSGAQMIGSIEGRLMTTIPIGGEYRCNM